MNYIKIDGTKIVARYNGTLPKGNEFKVIPHPLPVDISDIQELNPDGTVKTFVERIRLGFAKVPLGFKLTGNTLIPMTLTEKVAAEIKTIPDGMKLENDEFAPLTLAEKVDKGLEAVPDRMKLDGEQFVPMNDDELIAAGFIAEVLEKRIADKQSQIEVVEKKIIRSIKAIIKDTATPKDWEYFVAYDADIEELRNGKFELETALKNEKNLPLAEE